jgi:hypothetical protein
MVNVLASSAIDRGFVPWSGKTKNYKIGIRWFSAKTGWLGIRIMCSSGATCLPVDCYFSELAL